MNVDELMTQFKQMNNQLAEANKLNQDIFKEMMLQKSTNSLKSIRWMDYFGIFFSLVVYTFTVYCIWGQRENTLLLTISLIGFVPLTYLFKYNVQPVFIWQTIKLGSESIQQSLEKLLKLNMAYETQLKVGPIVVPFILLLAPVYWKQVYNFDFMCIFLSQNWWRNVALAIYIVAILYVLPKFYRKTYFKWINEIKGSLDQLAEKN